MREGEGWVYTLFWKVKKALILVKSSLDIFIYGLNFSFEMLFREYLGEKTSSIFPCTVFLSSVVDELFIKMFALKKFCLHHW